jgi:ribose transport system permease protein
MKRQLHMTTTEKRPEAHLFGERLRTLAKKSPIILIGLLIEILLFAVLSKSFLTVGNLISVTRQASVTAIISFGMTLVIITGGIDLSVGSIVAVAGVLAAFEMKVGMPVALAVVFGLAIGFVAGGINGVVISMTNIPAFAVTLGMMTAVRGVAGLISRGSPISVSDQVGFLKIGGGYVGMVPIPVIIALLVFFVLHVLLSHTKFGVNVYAVGGNESAANLCGINVKKVKTLVYIIIGVLSAISGIVLTSRLYSGDPSVGSGFELDAIAATILGGTSLKGGTGNLVGTLLGSLTIAVLLNGLTLLNVSYYNQLVIRGLVVMFALILMPKTD